MQIPYSNVNAADKTGDHSFPRTYVANLNPVFSKPDQHKGRPSFIKKLFNYARKRDVMNWAGFRVLFASNNRSRYVNEHRRRAINALVPAICHYVNLVTWQVECPVIELTSQCGLNTTSKNGIESISRGARAIQMLQKLGVITGELVWDRTQGTWTTKYLEVTERFFEMIGIDVKEVVHEQEKKFELIRAGLSPTDAGQMSLTKYKALRKQRSIERSFEIRRNKLTSKRDHARAKRIASMSIDDQRKEVAGHLYMRLGTANIRSMMSDPAAFDRLVTKEMRRLQAIATDPPPLH